MAAGNKTQPSKASVADFLKGVEPEVRPADAKVLDGLIRRVTGAGPALWGPSIVGYGRAIYRYASGREGEWFLAGFAPRKANLVLYVMSGFDGESQLMARLGKHSHGKSCLYINALADVDLAVLEELVARSAAFMRDRQADRAEPAPDHRQ